MCFVCIRVQCVQPAPFPVTASSNRDQGRAHPHAPSHQTSGSCRPGLPFLIPHHHPPCWWALSALSPVPSFEPACDAQSACPTVACQASPWTRNTHTKSLRNKSRMPQHPCPCLHSQLGHCHSRGPKVRHCHTYIFCLYRQLRIKSG